MYNVNKEREVSRFLRKIAKTTKSEELLEILSYNDIIAIRCSVAQNTNISSDMLERLSKDDKWEVRCRVVKNPRCSLKTLEILSKDFSVVRIEVAKHPNLSLEILEKLSKDTNNNVRVVAFKEIKKRRKLCVI